MGSLGSLPTPEPESEPKFSKRLSIIHVVHFRFYEHIPPAMRARKSKDFVALQSQCLHPKSRKPYIKSFTGGTDISVENLQRGYHTVFVLEFECEEDRDWYVNEDPVHRRFGVDCLTGVVEEVMVVDFRRGEF